MKKRQVRKFNILVSKNIDTSCNFNNNNSIQAGNREKVDNNNINPQLQDSSSNKWVINVSKTSLTEGQRSVLAK